VRGIKRLAVLTAVTAVTGLGIAAGPAFAAGTFTVSAHTTFDRTYTWAIQKTAHNPDLVLDEEQSFDEVYDVTVTNTGFVDSNWKVQDGILYQADAPFTPTSVTAVIQPGNIAAAVSCPAGLFGSTVSELYCTYGPTNLPNGTPGTVTVTVNFVGGSVSTTRNYNFTTDLLPNQPVEFKKCVDATDSFFGPLGTVCVGDSPKTFTYTRTIGPYHECGEFTVENTASLNDDPLHPSTSHATVHVSVPCVGGCTRTIGYWKNHAGFGPQDDVVTELLSQNLGTAGGAKTQLVDNAAEAVQFLSFRGSNNVQDASNGINKLYAQLLAAKLNIASGANGSAVAATIAAADAFLANNDSLSWASLSKSAKSSVLAWMTTLDNYNNGLIGPLHCSE
jgi:hypothetical protein